LDLERDTRPSLLEDLFLLVPESLSFFLEDSWRPPLPDRFLSDADDLFLSPDSCFSRDLPLSLFLSFLFFSLICLSSPLSLLEDFLLVTVLFEIEDVLCFLLLGGLWALFLSLDLDLCWRSLFVPFFFALELSSSLQPLEGDFLLVIVLLETGDELAFLASGDGFLGEVSLRLFRSPERDLERERDVLRPLGDASLLLRLLDPSLEPLLD